MGFSQRPALRLFIIVGFYYLYFPLAGLVLGNLLSSKLVFFVILPHLYSLTTKKTFSLINTKLYNFCFSCHAEKSSVYMRGFQRVCVHLYEVPQDSECSSQNYWLITSYVKVFFVSRCQMKHEGDHHHLPQPLWCWFSEEMGNRKRNGENSPCVQCSTPKQQIWVRVLLEKDSDVTALNTLMGFFLHTRSQTRRKWCKFKISWIKKSKGGWTTCFKQHTTLCYLESLLPCKVESALCRRQCQCTVSAHPYSGSTKINFFVQAWLCNSFVSCSHITLCHKMYATETNGFWGFVFGFFPPVEMDLLTAIIFLAALLHQSDGQVRKFICAKHPDLTPFYRYLTWYSLILWSLEI